jgi:hypothetical protein
MINHQKSAKKINFIIKIFQDKIMKIDLYAFITEKM